MVFLSGRVSRLVSWIRACYRLVWLLSIPVDSPRDQRGRSCSRNRRLGFGIRADNGRFLCRVRCLETSTFSVPGSARLFGAQGGIRTRNTLENYSSVARVTAVHTLGRLPRAADRAILPLRTPYSRSRARARHTCPGQSYPGKAGKLKPSQHARGQSRITVRD